jgi:hypothetical protein
MPYGMYRSPIAHGTPSQRRQEDALVLVNEHEERWWEGELYRLKGELLLLAASAVRDTAHTPEACFWQALDLARHQQAKSLELRRKDAVVLHAFARSLLTALTWCLMHVHSRLCPVRSAPKNMERVRAYVLPPEPPARGFRAGHSVQTAWRHRVGRGKSAHALPAFVAQSACGRARRISR